MSLLTSYNHLNDNELIAACDQHLANPLIAELQTRLAACVDRLYEIRVESNSRDEQLQRLIQLSEALGDRIEALENKLLLSETV
jgi:predicted nuclease with TOPRIM domain